MLAVYAVSRAVSALFIVVAARAQVAVPASLPSYHSTVAGQIPARYRDVAVNWDAQWYWDIVLHGYPDTALGPDGLPVQTSLAFFPLYPMLCRFVGQLTGLDFSVVGPTVSLLLGAAAVVMVYRLVAAAVGADRAFLTVVLLCTTMAAPVFQIAYTESLGLLLVATALYLLQQRRYRWALLPVLLLGLTRNITAVLAAVVLLHWAVRVHRARHATATPTATPRPASTPSPFRTSGSRPCSRRRSRPRRAGRCWSVSSPATPRATSPP